MEKPIISVVASANRTQWWMRFYNSLKGNKVPFEVIFVGNVKPDFELPENFRFIYATVKPCQCYQIGFWAAKGDLIHWTADDADYNAPQRDCPDALDRAYELWLDMEKRHNHDGKSVVAFRPIEDGGDVQMHQHYFFGACPWTPRMAPFALIPRKYVSEPGTGYDNRCVSGQAENDVIMRVFEDGGRVEVAMNAFVYVHHRQCHPRDPNTGREKNDFRAWYWKDREAIENAWVVEGYGMTQKYPNNDELRKHVTISPTRLTPLQPFVNTEDVCFVTQGEKGKWL